VALGVGDEVAVFEVGVDLLAVGWRRYRVVGADDDQGGGVGVYGREGDGGRFADRPVGADPVER
jgi:hypothetical protein